MPVFASETIQLHIAAWEEKEKEYKFLILKRAKHLQIYPSVWQVVTGKIEPGESGIDAALRECSEETGLNILKLYSLPFTASYYNFRNDSVNIAPVFGAIVDLNDDIELSPEHENSEWLGYNDCIDRLYLPSHKTGTEIFRKYILGAEDNTHFAIVP